MNKFLQTLFLHVMWANFYVECKFKISTFGSVVIEIIPPQHFHVNEKRNSTILSRSQKMYLLSVTKIHHPGNGWVQGGSLINFHLCPKWYLYIYIYVYMYIYGDCSFLYIVVLRAGQCYTRC